MANRAFRDVSFMLRSGHNAQVAKILNDPEASDNDKYVALILLQREVSCKGQLPIVRIQARRLFTVRKGAGVDGIL